MENANIENKIEKQIELKGPAAKVWDALTDYEKFGIWFRVKLDGPFIVGKPVTGHITYPGYEHHKWSVVIQKIENERLFSFTWHPYAVDLSYDYSKEEPTLVEFKLEKTPAGTLLTLTESGFDKIPENRRSKAFRMNGEGWSIQLENIKEYLASVE